MTRINHGAVGLILWALILAAWTIAVGCAGGTDVGNPDMNSFDSDAALRDFLVSQHAGSASSLSRQSAAGDAPPEWIRPTTGRCVADDTHTDIFGMDPGAPAKALARDGFLYVAGEKEVRIISVDRPETVMLSGRIAVEGRVDALHLSKNRLVVLYTPEEGQASRTAESDVNSNATGGDPESGSTPGPGIGILMADVSVAHDPEIIKHIQADGVRLASRITGSRLHVAGFFIPDLPPLQQWHDGTEQGAAEAEHYNARALADLTVNDLTPSYTAFDVFGNPAAQGRLMETGAYVRPGDPCGGGILWVITVDMEKPEPGFSSIGLIADIDFVYAAAGAFYLISTIYDDITDDIWHTRIHCIDISGENPRYAAFGHIPGRMADSSAIGCYQGVLRIASITGLFTDNSAAGHIFCLIEQNSALMVIGRLENRFSDRLFGTARFIGPKGYVMDAENSGRITIIDLDDPAAPEITADISVGQTPLSLFPVSENLMMAVTENTCLTDDQAEPSPGLCLHLLNVRNPSFPETTAMETISGNGMDNAAIFALSEAPLVRLSDGLTVLPVIINSNPVIRGNTEEINPVYMGVYIYQLTDELTSEQRGALKLWQKTEDGGILPPAWMSCLVTGANIYAVGPDRVVSGNITYTGGRQFEVTPGFILALE